MLKEFVFHIAICLLLGFNIAFFIDLDILKGFQLAGIIILAYSLISRFISEYKKK